MVLVAIGPKKALRLAIEYPSVYLTPLLTPFTFGPVNLRNDGSGCCKIFLPISCGFCKKERFCNCDYQNQCCLPNQCACNCNETKMMHLSFKHTYINVFLMALGSFLTMLYLDVLHEKKPEGVDFSAFEKTPIHEFLYIFPPFILLMIMTFQLLENRTYYCPKFCLPFTVREKYSNSQQNQKQKIEMLEIDMELTDSV